MELRFLLGSSDEVYKKISFSKNFEEFDNKRKVIVSPAIILAALLRYLRSLSENAVIILFNKTFVGLKMIDYFVIVNLPVD